MQDLSNHSSTSDASHSFPPPSDRTPPTACKTDESQPAVGSAAKPVEHFYKLYEGDAVRLAKVRGLKSGASFLGLAVHTNEGRANGRTCFPKVSTVARLSGQSDRTTSSQLRGLDDAGCIEIERRKRTSSKYSVVHSDCSKGTVGRNLKVMA